MTRRLQAVLLAASLIVAVSARYLFGTASGTDSALTGVPLDDAWIHLAYAQNFFRYGPFTYNPGDFQTGATAPLWTLVLSLIHVLPGVPVVLATKVLGVACGIFGAVKLYDIVVVTTRSHHFGLLGVVLYGVSPLISYYHLSGMEVSLSTMLTLWVVHAFLTGVSTARIGVLLGLALLTRPENLLLALACGVMALLDRERNPLGLVLPALVVVSPWLLYAFVVSDSVLPSTAVKTRTFELQYRQWLLLTQYFRQLPLFHWNTLLAAACVGWAAALVKRSAWRHLWVVGLLPLGVLLGYAVKFSVPLLTDTYQARYVTIFEAVWILFAVLGLQAVFTLVRARRPRLATGILVVAVAGPLLHQVRRVGELADKYSWDTHSITQQQVAMGRWVASTLPADAKIGVNDAGAIRYFALPSQTIYDLLALNNHDLVGGDPYDFVVEYRVEYLAIYDPWFPEKDERLELELIHSIHLPHNTVAGFHTKSVYAVKGPRR